MKAIRLHEFGGPEVLHWEDVPDPVLAAGQVVVDVKAAGVNPVDVYIRNGQYGPRPFPYIPGFDAAGTVTMVGAGVTRFKTGDRVYVYNPAGGAYAQRVLVDDAHVFPLPESVSFAQGAALGVPYATAYFALFMRAQAVAGETVLIHGASGGVGTAAVQLGRAAGLRVIGTAGTDKGLELARREGAIAAFDHHAADYLKQIMAFTGDKGVDIVLEMLANVNLANDLKILAKSGRVVVIGSRGKVEIDPRDAMTRLADIRGMSLIFASAEDLRRIHAGLGGALASGAIAPIIGREMPMADAAKAQEAVMASGAHGKIILVP